MSIGYVEGVRRGRWKKLELCIILWQRGSMEGQPTTCGITIRERVFFLSLPLESLSCPSYCSIGTAAHWRPCCDYAHRAVVIHRLLSVVSQPA